MRSAATAAVLGMVLAAGCGPMRGPAAPPAAAPWGAMRLGPGQVMAEHNAWADSIQHIWARAAVMLNFPTGDPKDSRIKADLEGHLFLDRPDHLYVHGEVLGQEVFSMGMNEDRFWLWIRPRVNTVWTWSRGGPGERRFVVTPDDLLTALGLFRIDLDPAAQAVFVAQERHYVLSEERTFAGLRVPCRRVWFDRGTLRPVRVDLFDETGRRILLAELLRYDRVGAADVCTVYRVRFYGDDEVDLVLRLSAVSLDKRPNPKVFEYRVPPGAKEEDLDKAPHPEP